MEERTPSDNVEPLFWYRPVGEDGGYEGPHHHSSQLGKMYRDAMPGQWKPLYEHPTPTPSSNMVVSIPDAVDHINRLIVALQPFVDFAQNVEYDEVLDAYAWKSTIHRGAVSSWFGPSDFAYAAFSVSDTKSCIAALTAEGSSE